MQKPNITNISPNSKIKELRKEYLLKRDTIISRLHQFQKFYNEPCSWIYSNGDIVLREVNTSHDHRIFEELCFCIFTANTSAEMGARAVDAVRDLIIDGSSEDMTKRLKGMYRFINKRPEYIVHTRNYLIQEINLSIRDKIASYREKNELRNYFAINKEIKGIGMKEASHFLRNIGFRGYAILDKHIINSMHEFGILKTNTPPANQHEYLIAEEKFMEFSNSLGIDMDELDLLLWSRKNGKILK